MRRLIAAAVGATIGVRLARTAWRHAMNVPHVAQRVDLVHHALRGWPIAHRVHIEGTLRVDTDDTLVAQCDIDGHGQDCIVIPSGITRARILGNILRNADTAIRTGWIPRPTFHTDLPYTWTEKDTVGLLDALADLARLDGPNDPEWH